MSDIISRQAAIDALCSVCEVDTPKTCSTIQNGDMWCKEVYILLNLPSAEPEKKELMADFVDTAEKAAKVEIMSEKDAQATMDYWRMYSRILETDHE